MRRYYIIGLALCVIVPSSAQASMKTEYVSLRGKAAKRFGKKEVKLNIAKHGVPIIGRNYSDKDHAQFRRASDLDYRRANKRLRAKLYPPQPQVIITTVQKAEQPIEVSQPVNANNATTNNTSGSGSGGGNLPAIRQCESGGNYSTDTGNGFYGAYQFTQDTWESVGGTGNPAQASPSEQDQRAQRLYSTAGAGQWPVCGR